jgi:hypothetical protein
MGPIILVIAKPLHDRIVSNILPLLIGLCLMPQPVIKEVLLPLDPLESCRSTLPVPNYSGHSRIAREPEQRMNVIGHQQEEFAPPVSNFVISLCCEE